MTKGLPGLGMTFRRERGVARENTWDGEERRTGKDRRDEADRRSVSRGVWERRSGLDRRGHKLYSALKTVRSSVQKDETQRLDETG
ncbi:MAG TPA: hypothetical protein VIO57_05315 [Chloroflexota bacterium]